MKLRKKCWNQNKKQVQLNDSVLYLISTMSLILVSCWMPSVVKAMNNKHAYVGKVEKLELAKFVNTEKFNEPDRQLVFSLRKTQEQEVNKYLNRNSPFSGMWENIIHTEGEELPDDTKALIIEYLHPRYRKLFTELA